MNAYQKVYIKYLQHRADWSAQHRLPGGCGKQKKEIYIVRRSGMKLGLCSYFNVILGKIAYAKENNYIPVVDMQHFNNSLLGEKDYGKRNAWEFFFEQPDNIELVDAYHSRKIILSDSKSDLFMPNDSMDFFNNKDGVLDYWRAQCREHVRIKNALVSVMESKYKELFAPNDRVLGVLARGTDYLKIKPVNHPIQPTMDQLIGKLNEVLEEQKCNKIFLATEDKAIVDKLRGEYGEKLVLNDCEYVDYKDGFLSDINLGDRKLKSNVDYLTNIYILSKCNCIVAGRTSGTVTAAVFSKGWEYSYFFDLGYYE